MGIDLSCKTIPIKSLFDRDIKTTEACEQRRATHHGTKVSCIKLNRVLPGLHTKRRISPIILMAVIKVMRQPEEVFLLLLLLLRQNYNSGGSTPLHNFPRWPDPLAAEFAKYKSWLLPITLTAILPFFFRTIFILHISTTICSASSLHWRKTYIRNVSFANSPKRQHYYKFNTMPLKSLPRPFQGLICTTAVAVE